eukprot:snap_masked-scaffold_2-processed-gene-0.25-mRNA-1 protein AED:1.00 eAED:1.00 QI:0/0/0/0/1/1/2/0/549
MKTLLQNTILNTLKTFVLFILRQSLKECKSSRIVQLVFQKDFNKVYQKQKHLNINYVIQGDEFCRAQEQITKHILGRQYFSKKYPGSFFFPLGPRFDVKTALFDHYDHDSTSKFTPLENFAYRKYAVNFIGSPTNQERKELLHILNSLPETVQKFVHLTPGWSKQKADDAKGYIRPKDYVKVLFDSIFTLCPIGHNAETFRIYEAIEAGSIPIVVTGSKANSNHKCKDSLDPLLSFQRENNPIVILESWNALPNFLEQKLANVDSLIEEHKKVHQWRNDFWKNFGSQLDAKLGSASQFGKVPLVTGCGRSGTFTVHSFLNSIGVSSVHEGMKPGAVSVSWLYAGKSQIYPFENQFSSNFRRRLLQDSQIGEEHIFSPVFHLVRHPLKVISSTMRCFCGKGNRNLPRGKKNDKRSWDFVAKIEASTQYKHLFFDTTAKYEIGSIRKSALYWYNWNKLIFSMYPAASLFQIETVTSKDLVQMLGFEDRNTSALGEVLSNSNFHASAAKLKQPDVTWKQLHDDDEHLAKAIFSMAQHFGYEIDSSFESLVST